MSAPADMPASPELVRIGALWVLAQDQHIYQDLPTVGGLPDVDVSKLIHALSYCRRFVTGLDVGAHVGCASLTMQRVFEQVVAFEAIPATYSALEANVRDHARIKAHQMAISDSDEDTYFEFVEAHTQISHTLDPARGPSFEGSTTVGPVTTRRIDDLDLGEVSFIKIDVEGSELDVLRGGERTIKTHRPTILMEQGGNDEKYLGRVRDEASVQLDAWGMSKIASFPYFKDVVYVFE